MFSKLGGKVFLTTGPVFTKTSIIRSLSVLSKDESDASKTQLRQDEMLYDHAFHILRNFLVQAAYNSVEDCQKFSNIKTPSPPWVRVINDRVAVQSCDQAATYMINAFGGEAECKRVIGGVHWWQVRGVQGVDAQWIIAKKDWEEEEKRQKNMTPAQKARQDVEDAQYHSGSDDDMRCILYIHGGGYYFGSVDQERYSTQRNARKINGRVFSINYRLAPQYPFPCAIQDALAAYLYLIRPPPGAKHKPINPNHITVYGDSAGGGLTFALLQLLRDNNLPAPAGAVIISPWCDLTHSFPSIHTNTDTDVLPVWGLSMQKPSTLWPPPTYEMTDAVHKSLRSRLRGIVDLDAPETKQRSNNGKASVRDGQGQGPNHGLGQNGTANLAKQGKGVPDVGATVHVPPLGSKENQRVELVAQNGEKLVINEQIHLYTQNSMLAHPLVSPVLSYLGGLPPMLIIAGDGEVLRDEIIYCAHKAAHPDQFKITDEAKDMYPPLRDIEGKYSATEVHLQVYDDAAHVLPILFFYTNAAKYCFRAMATFTKYVTNQNDEQMSGRTRGSSFFFSSKPTELASPNGESSANGQTILNGDLTAAPGELSPSSPTEERAIPKYRASTLKLKKSVKKPQRSNRGERLAGDPIIYSHSETYPSMSSGGMIRERVSIKGVVRPLEPQEELQAFTWDHNLIGVLSELAIRRYIDARDKFAKKYKATARAVEQTRRKNLAAAKQDIDRNVEALKTARNNSPGPRTRSGSLREEMQAETLDLGSGRWNWAWALSHDERPPPSSIVSRRDTVEARNLARIADQAVLESDGVKFSGNNIWAVMMQALQKKNSPDDDAELAGAHHPGK